MCGNRAGRNNEPRDDGNRDTTYLSWAEGTESRTRVHRENLVLSKINHTETEREIPGPSIVHGKEAGAGAPAQPTARLRGARQAAGDPPWRAGSLLMPLPAEADMKEVGYPPGPRAPGCHQGGRHRVSRRVGRCLLNSSNVQTLCLTQAVDCSSQTRSFSF